MKLDYLNDVTDDGKYPSAEPAKLLRLYDFEISELLKLRQEIKRNFVEENSNELTISNLDFIKAINCALTLHLANCDLGIKLSSKHNHEFVGSFSKETFVNMIKKIDNLGDGYNWLYEPKENTEIDLLLSANGGW
jgi:hypothetical protein